jgi:hypothetical protein
MAEIVGSLSLAPNGRSSTLTLTDIGNPKASDYSASGKERGNGSPGIE